MSVQSFLLTVHLNRELNLESKTLTTPKLNELQGPNVRLKLPLLGATIPPNLMPFRCTVMEKSVETFPNTLACTTTFTIPVHLHGDKIKRVLRQIKRSYRAPNQDASSSYWLLQPHQISLCSAAWFRRNSIKHFHIQGDGLEKRPFFVTVRKKCLIKVRQFKVNEKRN